MKKIIPFLFLMCFSTLLFAQNQVRESVISNDRSTQKITNEKMNLISHHKDLNDQMISLFGVNYASLEVQVIAQLKKNIADKNTPAGIRKNSLFVLYGDDYLKHADGVIPEEKSRH